MTAQPRLARLWRRLFPAPTGRRRRGRAAPTTKVATTTSRVIPPRPTYPPPLAAADPVPTRDEVFDQVMRRIARQSDVVAAGRPVIPHPRPEPRPTPPPAPPRPPAGSDGATAVDATAELTVVKITSMPTPPFGTRVPTPPQPSTRDDPRLTAARAASPTGVTAVIVPPKPDLTPDEFLVTEGWQRLFDAALSRDDVLSFTVRNAGASVKLTETTLEIPKILDPAERTPHLCKCCRKLSDGDKLTGRLWRCDSCHQIAAY